ncbi:MAG: FtsH protease activity modulator HflK, partial [bacterium]|nr:FtsH protease activity modulator HflK [bacterium]
MSWNEPGDRDDKNKKKDPWGKQEEGPPNIDEALRQLQQKLRAMFGGKAGGGGDGVNALNNKIIPSASGKFTFLLLFIVPILIYFAMGFFVVQQAEEAVVLRFGRYVRTEGAGLHWIAPVIEKKDVVNVEQMNTIKRGGPMLTEDENIVNAEIEVQYKISNARDYLFNLVNPTTTLEQVSDSALRSVVGQSTLNDVLTIGRSEISAKIRKQIEQNLDEYKSGLTISDVPVQQTKAPEEVKAAFDDAIKAQQDEVRLVNQAETYANKVIPIAEGYAKRTFEEALAYQEKVILEAQGKTAKFAKILPEYQRAPQVTRERLFIDTLQEVYTNTAKVLIDVNGGNNLVYLPLDKLMEKTRAVAATTRPQEESNSRIENEPQNMTDQTRRFSG